MSVAKIAVVLLLWIAFHSVKVSAVLVRGSCPSRLVLCDDRKYCIPGNWMCNGEKDCKDSSDEKDCGPCSEGQFRCTDRNQCINFNLTCNGKKDCRDGSDEFFCGLCLNKEFRCTDGSFCTPSTSVCNGKKDCPDGSDEITCDPCSRLEFRCADRNHCINSSLVCNGERDCRDGSDERFCDPCSILEFRCADGNQCINSTLVCNGEKDCRDGFDESFCDPCSDGQFRCIDGNHCIDSTRVCNGEKDCPDGSDEIKCDPCSHIEFRCADRIQCVNSSFMCNRKKDCKDGSDESFCDPCMYFQFRCIEGNHCIDSNSVCNGEKDCPDGSDEIMCDPCSHIEFRCADRNQCINSSLVCNGKKNCRDGSDESFCGACSYGQFRCIDGNHCIPSTCVCNGEKECLDGSDEIRCDTIVSGWLQRPDSANENLTVGNKVLNVPGIASTRARLISWFKQRRKSGSTVHKWGSQLPRVAVALHLANEDIFSPENIAGQEISYELTIQLLHHLSKYPLSCVSSRNKKMSSQELALYIQAMLVACMDPRDFYGLNLVHELRKRMEANVNHTNPFQILVLCNAGDTMTTRDVDKLTAAYYSQHRPFWTDTQALASMALACLSIKSNLLPDERILKDMLQELKKHQFRNGTVDNLKTTALVVQALMIYDSFDKDFDLKSALQSILQSVNDNITLQNAYYALPVLTGNSLLNVCSSHCRATLETEAEALEKALDVNGETISVQFSVWFGDEIELARTWLLKMHPNSSIYHVIETVAKIDVKQKVEYNVVEGKPFVNSLGGIEDDTERGNFWFLYIKNRNSDEEPEFMEQSPVDLYLRPNQEIILWYKPGLWGSNFRVPTSTTSN